MIEASYKKIILFFTLFTIIFSKDDFNGEFVFTNIIPIELSNASIGIRITDYNEHLKTYFNYQVWLTDNLSFDSYYSPSFDNIIDVTYGINLGYSSKLNNLNFKTIHYSMGYFKNKFSNNISKFSGIAITPAFNINDVSWILFSFDYSYSNKDNKKNNTKSLFCRYVRSIKQKFIINAGLQFYENNDEILLYPLLGINYIL